MSKIFISFLLFITSNYCFSQDLKNVTFSHQAGFYETSFYLKITADEGEVYLFKENNINNRRKLFPDSLLIDKNIKSTLEKIYNERKNTYSLANYKIDCSKLNSNLIVKKIIELYETN